MVLTLEWLLDLMTAKTLRNFFVAILSILMTAIVLLLSDLIKFVLSCPQASVEQ